MWFWALQLPSCSQRNMRCWWARSRLPRSPSVVGGETGPSMDWAVVAHAQLVVCRWYEAPSRESRRVGRQESLGILLGGGARNRKGCCGSCLSLQPLPFLWASQRRSKTSWAPTLLFWCFSDASNLLGRSHLCIGNMSGWGSVYSYSPLLPQESRWLLRWGKQVLL